MKKAAIVLYITLSLPLFNIFSQAPDHLTVFHDACFGEEWSGWHNNSQPFFYYKFLYPALEIEIMVTDVPYGGSYEQRTTYPGSEFCTRWHEEYSLPTGHYTWYIRVYYKAGYQLRWSEEAWGKDFYVDVTAPAPPVVSESHSNGNHTVWPAYTSHNTPYFTWSNPGDGHSGVSYYQVSVDGGSWSNVSSGWHPTYTGQHYFDFRSIDNAGNASSSYRMYVSIDADAPAAPTIKENHCSFPHGTWTNHTTPYFTWDNVSDVGGSGVNRYEVKVIEIRDVILDWTTVSSGWHPTYDLGIYSFYFRSVDNAGNVSSEALYELCIDDTPPNTPVIYEVNCGFTNALDGSWSSNNNPKFLMEDPQDSGSGFAAYLAYVDSVRNSYYQISSGWNPFLPTGIHSIEIVALDHAMNAAPTVWFFAKIDDIPPVAKAGDDFEITEGDMVSFDGSLSSDNIGIETYQWQFHDGFKDTLLTGVSPSYTFNLFGDYEIILMVSDSAKTVVKDTVMVHADIKQYIVSASAETAGEITPEGDTIIDRNRSLTYTIVPDSGYCIIETTLNDTSIMPYMSFVGGVGQYTLSNFVSNNTIHTYFGRVVNTWRDASDIIYGQTIGDSDLKYAFTNVKGDFIFTNADSVPNAGSHMVEIMFVPDDTAKCQIQYNSINLNVNKADPEIVWPKPDTIIYGELLSHEQLNASGNIIGNWFYNPPIGTKLIPDSAHILTLEFEPIDTLNYKIVCDTQYIAVKKMPQTIKFNAFDTKLCGDEAFPVNAQSSLELPVSYSASDTSVVIIRNDTVFIKNTGTAIISVSQAGNDTVCMAQNKMQSLTVVDFDSSVIQTGNILVANAIGLTYQWCNCSDSSLIEHETNRIFVAQSNGDYGVLISNNSCHIMSECLSVLTLNNSSIVDEEFNIFPNPANNTLFVESNFEGTIFMVSVLGEIELQTDLIIGTNTIDISEYLPGIHIVMIKTDKHVYVNRIIKVRL